MKKEDFVKIVRAYQAAMQTMLEANRLAPGKSTTGQLTEIALEVALHLPSFISDLMSMGEAKVPKSVKEVASKLGNGYRAQPGVSPRAVLLDAGLLAAALSGRLPEEKSPEVAALVDQARGQLRRDDVHLMLDLTSLSTVPEYYNDLT